MDKVSLSTIEQRDVSSIIEYSGNAKLHPDSQIDQIANSIAEFSFLDPIAVDEQNIILEGHGRLAAAKKMGIEQIPVIQVKGLTEAQKKAYRLTHNKLTLNSDFDNEAIALELEALKELEYDLLQTGFDSDEIDELLGVSSGEKGAGDGSEDDVPDVDEVEPRCELNQVWALGEHRLFVGDCTNSENVKRLMDGNKAVLMATDPPYGDSWVQKAKDMHKLGYGHSHAVLHGLIESDNLKEKDISIFLQSFLTAAKYAGDPPFPYYVWHGEDKRKVVETALISAGYFVHQMVVWVKPGFVISRMHYHPATEYCLHGWLQGNGKCPFYGERNQSDVWEVGRENDKIHPTQKPLELFLIPIKNHTKLGEITYDPFLGSGTCLIASHQSGRRCFGFEIQPNYAEVIMQRYENLTGDTAKLITSVAE